MEFQCLPPTQRSRGDKRSPRLSSSSSSPEVWGVKRQFLLDQVQSLPSNYSEWINRSTSTWCAMHQHPQTDLLIFTHIISSWPSSRRRLASSSTRRTLLSSYISPSGYISLKHLFLQCLSFNVEVSLAQFQSQFLSLSLSVLISQSWGPGLQGSDWKWESERLKLNFKDILFNALNRSQEKGTSYGCRLG